MSGMLRRAFELIIGALLIWYPLLPFQNFEQAAMLALTAALLWSGGVLFSRSKRLLSCRLFFYFAVLFAFYLRAGMQEGWMQGLMLWIFAAQWVFLLYFAWKYPEDVAGASLFLTLSLISPLFCRILENPWYDSLSGVALWILPLLHACFHLRLPRIPRLVQAALFWSLLAIPFSLYAWNSVLFVLIFLSCALLYLACRKQAAVNIQPLGAAYFALILSFVLFFVPREIVVLRHAGASILSERHYLVEHPNTASAFLIILAAILIQSAGSFKRKGERVAIYSGISFITILIILTYSRSGWIGFAIFIGVLAWRKSHSWLRNIALLVLVLSFFLTPVRAEVFQRVSSAENFADRANNWLISLRAISKAPLFGYGWLDYYAHTTIVSYRTPFEQLERNELIAINSHSMPLDLAETSGVPLALLFIAIVVFHIRDARRQPAVFAGILGVCANSLLDSGAFWLTVFPHFWVLLAFATSEKSTENPTKTFRYLSVVLVVFALAVLVEDRLLLLGDFYFKKGDTPRASSAIKVASALFPLDVVPLERMKDLYLSEKNVASAIKALNVLKSRRRNYAPYYTELGRLKKSVDDLNLALKFDSYTMLGESTYLELALVTKADAQDSLYKHLMYRLRWFDVRSRVLVDQIPEDDFIRGALLFARNNSATADDSFAASDHLATNLLNLRKPAAASHLLELLLAQNERMDVGWRDYFLTLLANAYTQNHTAQNIAKLQNLCHGNRCAYLTKTAEATESGNQQIAQQLLTNARDKLRYEDFVSLSEKFDTRFGKPEELRKLYRGIRYMPNVPMPDPKWSGKIAESYYAEKRFSEAAEAYRDATLEQWNSPQLHWWEARSWFLAGQIQKSEAANKRLQRLIPSSWFLSNLYRGRISESSWPVHLDLVRNENEFGGVNWQTVIFAHPPSTIVFPAQRRFAKISGTVEFLWGAWLEATDGVDSEIQNEKGMTLVFRTITAQHPVDHFDWISGFGSQAIILKTLPKKNPNFDWAVWKIDEAK